MPEFSPVNQDKPIKFTKAAASKEYLSGGIYISGDMLETLSYRSDEMTRRFGDDVIKRMLWDPEIAKCRRVIRTLVLSEGLSFFPALSKPAPIKEEEEAVTPFQKKKAQKLKKDHARYEEALLYSDFMNRCLKQLEKPFMTTLEGLLDALFYGNKVAEKVYGTIFDKTLNRDVFIVKSIRVKDRKSVAFVVDRFLKVVGLKGVGYIDGVRKAVIIPREKFMVFTFEEEDEDPRGKSKLEAVYNAWYLKTLVFPEYLKWLKQCAIPGLIGMMPPNLERKALINIETGEPLVDREGNVIYKDEAAAMLEQLAKMRNSSAMVMPNGASVMPLGNTTSGDPFKGMIDTLNGEMEMALLIQTLATSDSSHNTRAASKTHLSILDAYTYTIKLKLMSVIMSDYVKGNMEANFPGYDEELTPRATLGDSERHSWAEDASAIANLFRSGYLSESQLVATDQILELTDREGESLGIKRIDEPGPDPAVSI